MALTRRSTPRNDAPPPGPSNDHQDNVVSTKRSSALYDIFVLFAVPTNIIIPVIYLMIPAFKAVMTPDKLPAVKGLSIAIITVCSLTLCYVVPYFLFWLVTKAHHYKIIRLRRYSLMIYGLDNRFDMSYVVFIS